MRMLTVLLLVSIGVALVGAQFFGPVVCTPLCLRGSATLRFSSNSSFGNEANPCFGEMECTQEIYIEVLDCSNFTRVVTAFEVLQGDPLVAMSTVVAPGTFDAVSVQCTNPNTLIIGVFDAIAYTWNVPAGECATSTLADITTGPMRGAVVSNEFQRKRFAITIADPDPTTSVQELIVRGDQEGCQVPPTPSGSPSPTASATPSPSGTGTASQTAPPTPSPSGTGTASRSPSASQSGTPSASEEPVCALDCVNSRGWGRQQMKPPAGNVPPEFDADLLCPASPVSCETILRQPAGKLKKDYGDATVEAAQQACQIYLDLLNGGCTTPTPELCSIVWERVMACLRDGTCCEVDSDLGLEDDAALLEQCTTGNFSMLGGPVACDDLHLSRRSDTTQPAAWAGDAFRTTCCVTTTPTDYTDGALCTSESLAAALLDAARPHSRRAALAVINSARCHQEVHPQEAAFGVARYLALFERRFCANDATVTDADLVFEGDVVDAWLAGEYAEYEGPCNCDSTACAHMKAAHAPRHGVPVVASSAQAKAAYHSGVVTGALSVGGVFVCCGLIVVVGVLVALFSALRKKRAERGERLVDGDEDRSL